VGAGQLLPTVSRTTPAERPCGVWLREAFIGVVGRQHASSRYKAARLHTADAARPMGEASRLGTLASGMAADFVAYTANPFEVADDELRTLQPALTVIDGLPVFDRDGRLALLRQHRGRAAQTVGPIRRPRTWSTVGVHARPEDQPATRQSMGARRLAPSHSVCTKVRMTTSTQARMVRRIVIGRTCAGQPQTYRLLRDRSREARVLIILRRLLP
jgi:Amidohydrolase family